LSQAPSPTAKDLASAAKTLKSGRYFAKSALERPEMAAEREWLIQDILPQREIHFVAGPSGAGKTTWLFQMLGDWSRGLPVFGKTSYPVPVAYISCDRSLDTTQRTIERATRGIGLDLPIFCANHMKLKLHGGKSVENLHRIVRTKCEQEGLPPRRLLIYDGFASLCPDGKISDYNTVSTWLGDLADYCRDMDLTIIGLVHSTKTKKGEEFANPRQKILGSVAFAGFSETVFCVEPKSPEDPNDSRRYLYVLPRNSKEQRFLMAFDDAGRLVERSEGGSGEEGMDFVLESFLTPGREFGTREFVAWAIRKNVPERTAERYLVRAVDRGEVRKLSQGKYRARTERERAEEGLPEAA
jgi:AAA domain